MPFFDPEIMARWSSGEWNKPPLGEISGFSMDTRKLRRGDMFVALKAARDGHDYLQDAASSDARWAASSSFFTLAICKRKSSSGKLMRRRP